MSSVSHQTVKLKSGKHKSPDEGVCVMELASMLSGESFTDHPISVCPVIGSFMRAYNDSIDDERRQDLYGYASKVVGSHGSAAVQRQRAERLASWALQMRRRRWLGSFVSGRLRAIGIERTPPADATGIHAVRAVRRVNAETHRAALALIDELIAIGNDSTGTFTALSGSDATGARHRSGFVRS